MDQELRIYLDDRFRETTQQFQGLREETNGRFENVEAGIRRMQVMVEGVRSDLQLVAEGVLGSDEKIAALQTELKTGFDELRSMIRVLPYAALQVRVQNLESWRERKERDPIEIIRERFGKPKTEV